MNHVMVHHGFRVAHTLNHAGGGWHQVYKNGSRVGMSSVMRFTDAPPFLAEAGYPSDKFCCTEMTLIRGDQIEKKAASPATVHFLV